MSIRTSVKPRKIYVDGSVFLTKLSPLPFVQSKRVEETSQIFEVSVQPVGRRVIERLAINVRLAGSEVFDLGHFFAYHTHKVKPIVLVNIGEIVEVSARLLPASHWWPRLKDAVWDFFSPPRARVLLMGVVRKGEETN